MKVNVVGILGINGDLVEILVNWPVQGWPDIYVFVVSDKCFSCYRLDMCARCENEKKCWEAISLHPTFVRISLPIVWPILTLSFTSFMSKCNILISCGSSMYSSWFNSIFRDTVSKAADISVSDEQRCYSPVIKLLFLQGFLEWKPVRLYFCLSDRMPNLWGFCSSAFPRSCLWNKWQGQTLFIVSIPFFGGFWSRN